MVTNQTLVVLLTRNGVPPDADLSFLKSEVEGKIGDSYRRMSFGRAAKPVPDDDEVKVLRDEVIKLLELKTN